MISNKPVEELINIPCNQLKILSHGEKEIISRKVAEYYQEQGFPYYSLSDSEKLKCISRLYEFDVNSLELEGDELQQNMLGLNFINSYHPQMWNVLCGNAKKSPYDVFMDITLLEQAIFKRINLSDTKLQPFNIRKSLKIFGGYSVSNFRPTIAKYIYKKFCFSGGKTFDPCMGYGGRLFASLVSGVNYIGADPSSSQLQGNEKLYKDAISLFPRISSNKAKFYLSPFEDLNINNEEYDLVFTSPPYFDKEKYSYEDTQSFIRYPTYLEWRDSFLFRLIEKSYHAIKLGGYFIINVAGIDIVRDTIEKSNHFFGDMKGVKWMRLSKLLGRNIDKTVDKFKLEGIYIWQK